MPDSKFLSGLGKIAADAGIEVRYIYNSLTSAKQNGLVQARAAMLNATAKKKATFQGILEKYTMGIISVIADNLPNYRTINIGMAFYATEEGLIVVNGMRHLLKQVEKDLPQIIPLDHGSTPKAMPYLLEILDNPPGKRVMIKQFEDAESYSVHVLPTEKSPVLFHNTSPSPWPNAAHYSGRPDEKWGRTYSFIKEWPGFFRIGSVDTSRVNRQKEMERQFQKIKDDSNAQMEEARIRSNEMLQKQLDLLQEAKAKATHEGEKASIENSIKMLQQMIETRTPKAEAPKTEAPKAEAPKTEAPKAEAPKTEAPKAEAPKTEAPMPASPATDVTIIDTPTPPEGKNSGKAVLGTTTQDLVGLDKFGPDGKPDSAIRVSAQHPSPLVGVRIDNIGGTLASWETSGVKTSTKGVIAVVQDGKPLNADNAAFSLDVATPVVLDMLVQDTGVIAEGKTRLRVVFHHQDGKRSYAILEAAKK